MRRWARRIDALNERIGCAVSWLMPAMTAATLAIILFSAGFRLGWVWLHEAVAYMHAILFTLAAAYTWQRDEHVRIDIFYSRLSPRRQAMVNLVCVPLLLWPTCGAILFFSFSYVADSWAVGEGSAEGAAGLPLVFLLKTCILLMPILLLLQGAAVWLRAFEEFHRRR